jgi:protein SCO1/2
MLFAMTNPSRSMGQAVPRIFNDVAIAPEFGTKIPLDLQFVDSDGQDVRLSELFSDRPVILHLVYYECPMLCKLSNDGLLRALSTLSLKLGEDFSIITVSFDPREGPDLSARARKLAIEKCGQSAIENGWRFLTGDSAAIEKLCQAVGFRYTFDEATGQFAHASGAFVLTADGTLSRYLSGVEFAPRDLRLALVEASAGNVGTAADQVLLMCYMYDPSAGKYGVAIMTAVRLAGIATVGSMGLAIFTMLRRERRRVSLLVSAAVTTLPGGKA